MITVYGRKECVQCEWTKKWLDRLGHPYLDIDIDSDEIAQKTVAAMGFTTLPVVVTHTDRWAGFKLEKIRAI